MWSIPAQILDSMPLRKGSSQSIVSSNIKTLVDKWKKQGSIGSSHPPTREEAVKQAVAVALASAGKSRKALSRGETSS